jgi:hypothetical protein
MGGIFSECGKNGYFSENEKKDWGQTIKIMF